jgi:hypothetical protein
LLYPVATDGGVHVQVQLKPLHEFINTLGPMPPMAHVHTYISRLKEQGWNVWRIVKRAADFGHMDADLTALLRMPVRPHPPASPHCDTPLIPP